MQISWQNARHRVYPRICIKSVPNQQGFMAAASMNRAGYDSDVSARQMVTLPSSSGWRRFSSTACVVWTGRHQAEKTMNPSSKFLGGSF